MLWGCRITDPQQRSDHPLLRIVAYASVYIDDNFQTLVGGHTLLWSTQHHCVAILIRQQDASVHFNICTSRHYSCLV